MLLYHRIEIRHFHQGNNFFDSQYQVDYSQKGRVYITRAVAFDIVGNIVGIGHSFCARKDKPSRNIGRNIALTRLEKSFNPQREITSTDIAFIEGYLKDKT